MNEQLVVKNFGPIKDATVDFKRVTVFIGPTGGGKSTLAKLAAIFRTFSKLGPESYNRDSLEFYQLLSFVHNDSKAKWLFNKVYIELNGYNLQLNKSFSNLLNHEVIHAHNRLAQSGNFPSLAELQKNANNRDDLDPIISSSYKSILMQIVSTAIKSIVPPIKVSYIPAERIYASAVTGSLAAMLRDNFNLPKTLSEFINQFIIARDEVKQMVIEFLSVKYRLESDEDLILHSKNNSTLMLHESASGIQSVTPMLVLLDYLSRNTEQTQSFIIEEPELNLYPTAQQGLLNWLVEKCTNGENDLTITTHSPYILSSCNLLLEAYKVAQQRPELEAEVAAIVPKACWINPDEFAAYYVADSTVKPITDMRTHLIGANELDAVSGDISDSFRQLLRLKKQAV